MRYLYIVTIAILSINSSFSQMYNSYPMKDSDRRYDTYHDFPSHGITFYIDDEHRYRYLETNVKEGARYFSVQSENLNSGDLERFDFKCSYYDTQYEDIYTGKMVNANKIVLRLNGKRYDFFVLQRTKRAYNMYPHQGDVLLDANILEDFGVARTVDLHTLTCPDEEANPHRIDNRCAIICTNIRYWQAIKFLIRSDDWIGCNISKDKSACYRLNSYSP